MSQVEGLRRRGGVRGRSRRSRWRSAVASARAAAATTNQRQRRTSGTAAEGGEITISQTSQPDFLDPALTYTVNGIEPLWLVYTPLLTYRHEEGQAGTELIPGLAEDLPEISEDGLTYTLKLRDGLKYSDGTPAVASDFEHSIKRVLNLESGGSFFFEFIEGATEYIEAGDPEGDISGIKTDDKTGEIEITLTEPYGGVPERARDVVRRTRPRRHPVQEPDRGPAPGHRSVHDHRVGPEP